MENVFEEACNALLVTRWRRSNLERRTVRMRLRSTMKYLASARYPETATKVEKGVIRKQAKRFLLVDGVLHSTSKPLPSFLYIMMQFCVIK